MTVRKITDDNDWTFGKGKNNYLTGKAAVSQNIKTRLQSFLGDCFFALQDGIDWFALLGAKDIEGLRLAVSTTILNTRDVTKLNELEVVLDDNRNIKLTYTVTTSYGTSTDSFIQEI